ncbi:MAG: TIGR02996 domain-containing protein [Bacteroidales bacterium]|nr:TIGR02996 domain-containing protein [Bacteroidales bacterium]
MFTEWESLIAAIAVTPSDDMHWLVLADWLDEHEEFERAEFIRTEIAIKNPQPETRLESLIARRKELWERRHTQWLAPFYDRARILTIQCGFVTGISIDATQFQAHASEWFSNNPITQLQITNFWSTENREVREWHALTVFGCPYICRIQQLILNEVSLDTNDLRFLCQTTDLRNLRLLSLIRNDISTEGAVILAETPTLVNLVELDLSNNFIRDRGVSALLDSPYLGNLRNLHLDQDALSHRMLGKLRDRFSPSWQNPELQFGDP